MIAACLIFCMSYQLLFPYDFILIDPRVVLEDQTELRKKQISLLDIKFWYLYKFLSTTLRVSANHVK